MRGLLVLLIVGAVGCAGPRSGAETELRSGTVRLGSPISASSTVGTREFVLRAFAQCPGVPCHAESYRVAFSNVGQNALNTSYSGVSLRIDGRPYAWDTGDVGVNVLPNTYGEFMAVEMPRDWFKALARAETVRVELGETEFLLTQGTRRTLLDLLARTTEPGAPDP